MLDCTSPTPTYPHIVWMGWWSVMDVAVCCYYNSNPLLLLVTVLPLLLLLKFVLFYSFSYYLYHVHSPFSFLFYFTTHSRTYILRHTSFTAPPLDTISVSYSVSSFYYNCSYKFFIIIFLLLPCLADFFFFFLKDQFISKHAISLLLCFCWQTFIFITNMSQCYSVCIHSLCIGFVNSPPPSTTPFVFFSLPFHHTCCPQPHTPLRAFYSSFRCLTRCADWSPAAATGDNWKCCLWSSVYLDSRPPQRWNSVRDLSYLR